MIRITNVLLLLMGLQLTVLGQSTVVTTSIDGLDDLVAEQIKKRAVAGAVVLVAKGDEILHFSAQGYQDLKEKKLMEQTSIFRIYSMTKPISSAAVMILQERGLLNLDDPVAQYIPELAELRVYEKGRLRAMKKPISIRDLMRHTAGFTYGFFSNTKVDKLYNKQHPLFVSNNTQFLERLARLPLLHQPGEQYHYSVATDILGVLIERVSKTSLEDFLEKEIFEPLDMKDTGFYVPKVKLDRFCSSYKPGLGLKEGYRKSDFVGVNPYRRASAGGGLVSTAEDYLKFGQLLRNKGTWQGVQILKEASVLEMTKNQLASGDFIHKGTGFGLGVSVQLEEWGIYGHRGDYGWNGAASTHFLVSPQEDAVIIILSQIEPYSHQLMQGALPIIYRYFKNQ